MARKKSNNLNKRGGFLTIFGKSKKKSKKKSKREEKTSLKKKYSKICKKECKNKKYLGEILIIICVGGMIPIITEIVM